MGVNAIACAPKQVEDPAFRAGAWPTHLGRADRAPSATERLGSDLAPWWEVEIGRAVAGAPALGDTVVAVLSVRGHLSLVAFETGEVLWRRDLDGPGVGGPLLAQSRIYAATGETDGRLYALDVRRGRTIWEREIAELEGTPVTHGDRVVVTTRLGAVIGLRTEDGEPAWRTRLAGPIRSGPAVAGDAVLVATDDSLHLLTLSDGARRAAVRSLGAQVAPPAVTDRLAIVTSPDGIILALDAETLEERWRVPVDEPVFGSPAVARDTVFAVTLGGRLWRIPLDAPRTARATDLETTVRAEPAPIADGVVVGTVPGEILIVRNGIVSEPHLRVDGPIDHQPLVHRNALLVVDGRGTLRAWR